MLDDTQANAAVRGLIFAVQKTRSDLREGLGGDEIGEALLRDLHPWLFGDDAVLAHLLRWQARCKAAGIIAGADLFNFVKLIEMKDSVILSLLSLYGYPSLESDISWFGRTWPYVE